MASGYIHISRKDVVFDNDNNVVYWKNGARYLGEIAKAVLNPGEETEVVKYYLKSAVTKKAILIDAGVVVGGGDYYFITDDANFINVRIETADFSSDGGGDGVTVTFLLPESKYYTVYYIEENGDIKLYDVDGDAGTLIPDALPDTTGAAVGDALVLDADKKPVWAVGGKKYYIHSIYFASSTGPGFYGVINIIDDKSTDLTVEEVAKWLYDHKYNSGARVYPCTDIKANNNNLLICKGLYSSSGAYITFNPNVISVSNNAFSVTDYGGNNITTISSQTTNEL